MPEIQFGNQAPYTGSISKLLEQYTASISNFETARKYVSLSHIGQDEGEIIRMYKAGFDDSEAIRLRCYKGYQMEKDLLKRIGACFPRQAVYPFPEISMLWGHVLIQGHPDFSFEGYPGDCKTVPLDEHFPREGKLPRKVYWQMQAYMRFSEKEKGLVIYESRETGAIRHYWIRANESVQRQIYSKLKYVVDELHLEMVKADRKEVRNA